MLPPVRQVGDAAAARISQLEEEIPSIVREGTGLGLRVSFSRFNQGWRVSETCLCLILGFKIPLSVPGQQGGRTIILLTGTCRYKHRVLGFSIHIITFIMQSDKPSRDCFCSCMGLRQHHGILIVATPWALD